MHNFLSLLILSLIFFITPVFGTNQITISDASQISRAGEAILEQIHTTMDSYDFDTPARVELKQMFDTELELQGEILVRQKLISGRPDWLMKLIGPDYRTIQELDNLVNEQKLLVSQPGSVSLDDMSEISIAVNNQSVQIDSFIDSHLSRQSILGWLVQKLMINKGLIPGLNL